MCLTWGDFKAKMEDGGVRDDHELNDVCVSEDDNCIRVIHEDGVVSVEGVHHADEEEDDYGLAATVEPESGKDETTQDKAEEGQTATPAEGGDGK